MSMVKLMLGLLAMMVSCGACYWVGMLNLMTTLTARQLNNDGYPFFAEQITAWQLGQAMDTYSAATSDGAPGTIAAGHPTSNYTTKGFPWGQMPPTGYVGPLSFLCAMPIKTDAIAVLTAGFDWQKIDAQGNPYLHSAFDYAIAGQTYPPPMPVMTVMGGKVIYANYYSDNAYGNLVVIENNGVLLYLAHLESISASVGDVLSAGDVVGIMGSTGPSSAPHVHLEYRWADNTPFDPRVNDVPGQMVPCVVPYTHPGR